MILAAYTNMGVYHKCLFMTIHFICVALILDIRVQVDHSTMVNVMTYVCGYVVLLTFSLVIFSLWLVKSDNLCMLTSASLRQGIMTCIVSPIYHYVFVCVSSASHICTCTHPHAHVHRHECMRAHTQSVYVPLFCIYIQKWLELATVNTHYKHYILDYTEQLSWYTGVRCFEQCSLHRPHQMRMLHSYCLMSSPLYSWLYWSSSTPTPATWLLILYVVL